MPAPVWGTAEPNADILVEFGGKKVSTKAEISGKWRVVLPKMKADKTPKEMTVFENSMPAKKIKNILVGEVWVASGQSNMEWNVSGTDTAEETKKKSPIILKCAILDSAETSRLASRLMIA